MSQTAAGFIEQGDSFAAQFDNSTALDFYKRAHEENSEDCTALWKLAQAYVNLGEEADKSVQRQYYYVAEKWARQAVEQCPQTANAHFFVAVTAGHLALLESGRQKVERSRTVKEACERTIALDPMHHGAYHILGRWHAEVATLSWVLKTVAKIVYGGVPPGASLDLAVEYLKKAIEISPDWINHHRQLGEIYMKREEWELASREFETVLALPIRDHEDKRHKKVCARYLEDLRDK